MNRNRRQRICPVCGHLESEGTDCCTECGARTIEYEEASYSKEPGQTSAATQPNGATGESGDGSRSKKKKGKWILLPLALVLAVATAVLLPKGDSGRREEGRSMEENRSMEDSSEPSTESDAATPTPGLCEAFGHDWAEANYQEPRTCSVCGETAGDPLVPSFELHGLRPNMEEGVTYDYVTACNKDHALKTVGKLTVSGYRAFPSDDSHEAKYDYEWRTLHLSITFDDDNAYNYGIELGFSWNDYYDIEGMDDSTQHNSDGTAVCTANYYGTDYTECVISWEGQGFGEWSEGPHHTLQFDMDLYALLPIGYDGWVITFYDSSIPWDSGMYIYDIADGNTLFFRMG